MGGKASPGQKKIVTISRQNPKRKKKLGHRIPFEKWEGEVWGARGGPKNSDEGE